MGSNTEKKSWTNLQNGCKKWSNERKILILQSWKSNCIYLSNYLFLAIWPLIYLSINLILPFLSINVLIIYYIYLSLFLLNYLNIYLSFYLSTNLSVYLSILFSIYLNNYLKYPNYYLKYPNYYLKYPNNYLSYYLSYHLAIVSTIYLIIYLANIYISER